MLERKGILLCFVGPAGSGKTSLGNRLLQLYQPSLQLSISVTSRSPRSDEVHGTHYRFVSRQDFEAMRDRGEFFEWEETHGNYYGTPRETIESAARGDFDLLLDVDIRGALNFRKEFSAETVISFLLPPTPETLVERINKRGDVSEEDLASRLKTAEREYQQLLEAAGDEVDYVIINDAFEETLTQLQAVLLAERSRLSRISLQSLEKMCVLP